MTNVSDLLIPGGNSGQFLTDPRDLRRYMTLNLFFWKKSPSLAWASSYESGDAPYFWDTLMAQDGAAISSTAWSADTYKTVMDVSGRGFVYNIIGPALATVNNLFTARITLDGFPFTISGSVKDVNTCRLVLGALEQPGGLTTTNLQGDDYSSIYGWSATKTANRNNEGFNYQPSGFLMEENRLHMLGQVLKFNTSFKFEIKSAGAISVDASRRNHYAGVRYALAN